MLNEIRFLDINFQMALQDKVEVGGKKGRKKDRTIKFFNALFLNYYIINLNIK